VYTPFASIVPTVESPDPWPVTTQRTVLLERPLTWAVNCTFPLIATGGSGGVTVMLCARETDAVSTSISEIRMAAVNLCIPDLFPSCSSALDTAFFAS
jgi:hypothetical protein